MKLRYKSDQQKYETECMVCFGYEITDQSNTGSIILNNFKHTSEGISVLEEVHILPDGAKVEYE